MKPTGEANLVVRQSYTADQNTLAVLKRIVCHASLAVSQRSASKTTGGTGYAELLSGVCEGASGTVQIAGTLVKILGGHARCAISIVLAGGTASVAGTAYGSNGE
jgi:hypothetical protein